MNPTHIPNANRQLGPPRDWDAERNGPCEVLELLDTGEFFQSAWVPDSQELACIQAGAPVVVTVWGRQHPPIGVAVMPKPGYVTLEAYQAAYSALRNLTFMCRTASGVSVGGDQRLLASIELAESVVGGIPPDAKREKGDAQMLEVPVPQGLSMRDQIAAWRDRLGRVAETGRGLEPVMDEMAAWLETSK